MEGALTKKRVADSLTKQVQIILPQHINGYGRLFGGQLMQWIDVVAAVVARRHSNRNVTTASVDRLEFKAAAFVDDTITLIGRIVYTGRTSMQVRVDTYVECLDGERKLINTAYLVMVALDEQQRPAPVPGLLLETEEERTEWELGRARKARK